MILSNYTPKRAETLFKMQFSEYSMPLGYAVHWIDVLGATEIEAKSSKQIHEHSFYEMHFVASGEALYEHGGTTSSVSAGQALFLPSGIKHKYLGMRGELIKTTIAFSIDAAKLKLPQESVVVSYPDYTVGIIDQSLKLSDRNDVLAPYLILSKSLEAVSAVFDILGIALPDSFKEYIDPRFEVAKSFIERNVNSPIALIDVASECCLSPKQLNRVFKAEMNCSVSKYIAKQKIALAKKLLLDNEGSVKEICYALGFESESSFITYFKRHCGLTPGAFKKLNFTKRKDLKDYGD